MSIINKLHLKALKNKAEAQSLLHEIRGIWFLIPGFGFHIYKYYGPGDIRAPLSTLADMMITRSSMFEGCKEFIDSSINEGNENWLSSTSFSSMQQVTRTLDLEIRTLKNDQILLKISSLRILHLCANEIMILSYIFSRQVLGSKLNTCALFTHKISEYVSDFVFARRVCKTIQLCRRLFFSTKEVVNHVVGIFEKMKVQSDVYIQL